MIHVKENLHLLVHEGFMSFGVEAVVTFNSDGTPYIPEAVSGMPPVGTEIRKAEHPFFTENAHNQDEIEKQASTDNHISLGGTAQQVIYGTKVIFDKADEILEFSNNRREELTLDAVISEEDFKKFQEKANN